MKILIMYLERISPGGYIRITAAYGKRTSVQSEMGTHFALLIFHTVEILYVTNLKLDS